LRGVYHRRVALFLLRGWVHYGGITFFLFRRGINRCLLLLASCQQGHACKQANISFHTNESRLGTDLVAFDQIPNLVERRIY